MRVSFTHTWGSSSSPLGASAASAAKNAADDGSPGTSRSSAVRDCPPNSRTAPSLTHTSTPCAASIRSVWSRERTGSRTVASTRAHSAASSTQLFTCALEVSLAHSICVSGPPCTVIGSPPCASSSTRAPMTSRGRWTRRMGRRLRLSSPMKRPVMPEPATTPASKRADVPLLPQSRSPPGVRRPDGPTPVISIDASRSGTTTPSARSTPAVARTSADGRIPRTRDTPDARALKISARCDIDLSPGTRNSPATRNLESVSGAILPALWRDRFAHRGTSRSRAFAARAPVPLPSRH